MCRIGLAPEPSKLRQEPLQLAEKADFDAARSELLFRLLVQACKIPRLIAQCSVGQERQTLHLAESTCEFGLDRSAQLEYHVRPIRTRLILNEKNLPGPLIQALMSRPRELLRRHPCSRKELLDVLSSAFASAYRLVH